MNGKLKAIMELLKNMDEDMLKGVDMKGKMEETLDAKPKMSITKVAVMKPKMEESEGEEKEYEDEESSDMSDWMPKEGDENDPIAKLKKKFTGK